MIVRPFLLLLLAVVLVAPRVAAEPGVTDTEIVVGGSNSFSGPLAYTGEQITKFGVDLYFKVVNDAGGIHGRKVRAVYYDDGYRPQDAVANTKKLVEQDNVFAIIIPQGSPPVVATLEYLEQQKVPMLFPYQSSPVTRGRRYVFQGMVIYKGINFYPRQIEMTILRHAGVSHEYQIVLDSESGGERMRQESRARPPL